jgi:hypothetical protein
MFAPDGTSLNQDRRASQPATAARAAEAAILIERCLLLMEHRSIKDRRASQPATAARAAEAAILIAMFAPDGTSLNQDRRLG